MRARVALKNDYRSFTINYAPRRAGREGEGRGRGGGKKLAEGKKSPGQLLVPGLVGRVSSRCAVYRAQDARSRLPAGNASGGGVVITVSKVLRMRTAALRGYRWLNARLYEAARDRDEQQPLIYVTERR